MMSNKYKTLGKNTLIFTIGNFGSRMISFFLVPLYTNVLTAEEYGTADLVSTLANLIVPFVSLVIQDAVLRFGLQAKSVYGKEKVIKNALLIFCFGSIISILITPFFGFYKTISPWKNFLSITCILHMGSNIMFSYARAKEQNKLYAIAGMLQTFLIASFSIFFIVIIPLGIKGYLISQICAIGITITFLFLRTKAFHSLFRCEFDFTLMKEMLCYSCPLIINNISWWIINSSDRMLIELFCSTSLLGLYTAASKIPNFLSIITSVFSQAWSVSAIKEYDGDKDKTFYSKVFKMYSLSMFIGGSFLILVIKLLMQVYVGKNFYDSWSLIPFLVVGVVFHSFSSFFSAIYMALKKSINVSITTSIAAIINITIDVFLLPRIGVIAASLSTMVSYIAIGVIQMLDSRRFIKFDIRFDKLLANSLVLVIQSILITLSIYHYLVSCLSILIIIIINSDDLKLVIEYMHRLFVTRLNKHKQI